MMKELVRERWRCKSRCIYAEWSSLIFQRSSGFQDKTKPQMSGMLISKTLWRNLYLFPWSCLYRYRMSLPRPAICVRTLKFLISHSLSHRRYVRRLPPPGFPPLVEGSLRSELLENQETGGWHREVLYVQQPVRSVNKTAKVLSSDWCNWKGIRKK